MAAATAVSPHGVLDRSAGDGAGEQELPQRRSHRRGGDLSEVDEEPERVRGRDAGSAHRPEISEHRGRVGADPRQRHAAGPIGEDEVDRCLLEARDAPEVRGRTMRRDAVPAGREHGGQDPLLRCRRRTRKRGDSWGDGEEATGVQRRVPRVAPESDGGRLVTRHEPVLARCLSVERPVVDHDLRSCLSARDPETSSCRSPRAFSRGSVRRTATRSRENGWSGARWAYRSACVECHCQAVAMISSRPCVARQPRVAVTSALSE